MTMNSTWFRYWFGNRALRRAGLGVAIVLAGTLAAGAASAEEWTKSYTVNGRARVHVDTNDGAVRITSSDSNQVDLRVIYEGYKMDRDLTVASHQNGDAVDVSARVRGGFHFGW